MNFNESLTKQNLAKSFAAECQAGARYQFMATQAQLSKLFFIKDTMKMIAKNEMAHAKLFYDYIVEKCGEKCKVEFDADYPYVSPMLDVSLKTEEKIEREEFETIYPEFAKIAKDEGFADIAKSFELVAKVEKTHSAILNCISKKYDNKSLYKYKGKSLVKCSNCGHIDYLSEGWQKCPLCNLEQGYIELNFTEAIESATKNE